MKIFIRKFLRFFHKYVGIPISAVMIYMCISGILLNHKDIISHYDWPGALLPSDMKVKNWGRSAVLSASEYKDGKILLAGKLGVLVADRNGTVSDLNRGLPEGVLSRTVNSIHYKSSNNTVYAGLTTGLYYKIGNNTWTRENIIKEPVVSIIEFNNSVLVFTRHNCYRIRNRIVKKITEFVNDEVTSYDDSMSAVEFTFRLHSGEILGLPGKLLIDLAGVVLLLISFSGLLFFISPLKFHNSIKFLRRTKLRLAKIHFKHHKGFGVTLTLIFFMFAITGFFMRPPFIMALLGKTVPLKSHEVPVQENTWKGSMSNVSLSPHRKFLYVMSDNILYRGSSDMSRPFQRITGSLNVHPMGTRSMTILSDNRILVGSFSGILELDTVSRIERDYFTGRNINSMQIRKSGPYQVNGAFKINGKTIIIDYRKGLFDLETGKPFLKMPENYRDASTFSLWNFMFELHNGRIYKSLIGKYYILVNPLVSLLFFLILLSGILYRTKQR